MNILKTFFRLQLTCTNALITQIADVLGCLTFWEGIIRAITLIVDHFIPYGSSVASISDSTSRHAGSDYCFFISFLCNPCVSFAVILRAQVYAGISIMRFCAPWYRIVHQLTPKFIAVRIANAFDKVNCTLNSLMNARRMLPREFQY